MMFHWFDAFMEMFGFTRSELNEHEAAEYIGRSLSTLRAYRGGRKYKRVPEIPYHMKDGKPVYLKKNLDAWREQRGMVD